MTDTVLKKTIFISLIGHLTVFSIFGLSFGNRIPRAEYTGVCFWGQFLRNSQVSQPTPDSINQIKEFFTPTPKSLVWGPDTSALDRTVREQTFLSRYYFPAKAGSRPILSDWREKPPFSLAFNSEKEAFVEIPKNRLFSTKTAKPPIIFHPLLPYGFTLYFKDRQVAHVELMFKTVSAGERDSLVVKRKISSGNLEVDLLVMRYIWHYLFIQQSNIPANNWQAVKIDLSAKND